MKILVETTGEFQLVDPETLELMPFNRPAVVTSTTFVESRAAKGEVIVLFPVTDEATDEEFATYWNEASDIAVESFKSAFGPDVKPAETKAEKKTKAEAEKKAEAEAKAKEKTEADKAKAGAK